MDWLDDLNEPQREAVTHVDGPMLVLAGAGSGKTRVIIYRVANLIAQGVAPWNILAITFTNKAAAEMRQRVEALNAPRGATICTFHALCARLLREFATEANLEPNYSIYDRKDQLAVVKDAMSRLDLKTSNFTPTRVHSTISKAKNAMQTVEDYAAAANDFYSRAIVPIFREYDKNLAANNALDFDDLLLRVAFLLRDRPDIRKFLGERYKYVQIDEYQDTNKAQYLLAHGIAADHENICATGDPDQSIYAWRGADIKNILEFESDYPNAKIVHLEENYRSTQFILAAASRLISHNQLRKDKTLWTSKPGGADVHVVICDDAESEARQIAQRIADYRTKGGAYSDVAVFYRVNSLSRVMEQSLLNAGIAYCIARGVEFYSRKEVKDTLAYLRLLVNPADDISCERIINTPTRGIGATTVKRLKELGAVRNISLREACRVSDEAGLGQAAVRRVSAFSKLLDELAENLAGPVRPIMENVVHHSGLEESLRNQDEGEPYANVGELISTAAEFDSVAEEPSLADYLHQISLVSDVDHMKGMGGAVTMMTLHAAKGLEFPMVFIIGCEDGLLPFDRGENALTRWSGDANPQLEEERRLAFVGMTRAEEHLTLSCARYRMIRGRTTPQTPSMFLEEIGAEGVATEDLTTATPIAAPHNTGRGGFYADSQERSLIEAAQAEHPYPPEYEYLREGCMIRHPKFGVGRVVKLSQPWPQTRAMIHFEQWGPKKIVLSMTNVEILGAE